MTNRQKLIELLRSIDFDQCEIDTLVEELESETDLKYFREKMNFLMSMDFRLRIIRLMIEEDPLFMTTSIDDMKGVLKLMKSLNLNDYIQDILEVNPELLSTPKEKIATNINLLRVVVREEKKFFEILKEQMVIFMYNTEYLEKRLEFFIKNGFQDSIYKIILKKPELFDEEEELIDLDKLREEIL